MRWAFVYCATKFAVSGITEALYADVKDLGIQVTLVYPGYFRTNFLNSDSMTKAERSIGDYKAAHESIDLHEKSIKGNQPGDPEKLAQVLIDYAHKPNAPLHLFLGADAYETAQAKLKTFATEIESFKKVSESTGIDQ